VRGVASWLVVLCVGVASAPAQQPAPAKKSFDVASIKPAPPLDPQRLLAGQQRIGMKVDAGRVDIEGWSIIELLNAAYKVSPARISGPAWPGLQAFMSNPLAIQRYDVHATIPAGATKDNVPEMIGSLLAERWKLQYHTERKEQDVLALVVGKDGPKLEKSPEETLPDPAAPANNTNRPDAISVSGDPTKGQMTIRGAGQAGTLKLGMSPDGSAIRMEAERVTMQQLADSLIQFTGGRPVVDMTGMIGNYKVAFEISREEILALAQRMGVGVPGAPPAPAGGASDPGGGTSAFRSVEKMGLKLEQRKAPVDNFVIDRLEKTPTED
jgi:uncharacterized protein (TIGR03435 family)